VTGDGVWRIRRKERSATIEVFKLEETGHGDILSDEFINWRIKLALNEGGGSSMAAQQTREL
jgi:RAT1-interacting protein